jgi:hypothetical protein
VGLIGLVGAGEAGKAGGGSGLALYCLHVLKRLDYIDDIVFGRSTSPCGRSVLHFTGTFARSRKDVRGELSAGGSYP